MTLIKRINFLYGFVNIISVLCTAVLLAYACLRLDYSSGLFREAGKPLILSVLAAAVILQLLLLHRIFDFIERLRGRGLFVLSVVLFALMLICYVLVLRFFSVLQITDAHAMYDEAMAFAAEPGRVHHAGDLYVYYEYFGNNYFLTLVFARLFRLMSAVGIKDLYLGLNVINCFCLFISCLFGFLAVRAACGMKTAVRVLVLLVMNPTFYVLSTWLYSCTVSIPLMTLSILLAVNAYKTDKNRVRVLDGGLIGIVSMFAYYLRPTSMFPMLAALAVSVILLIGGRVSKKELLSGLLAIAVMAVCLLGVRAAVNPYIDRHFSEVSDLNFPIEHWLMLGSTGNGSNTVGGMDYTMSFATKEEKAEACRAAAIDNYRAAGLSGAVKLWIKKDGITFSDGFSGMNARTSDTERYSPIYRFVAGDHREILMIYSRAFRIVTFLLMIFAGIAALVKRKYHPFMIFAEIIFLGGLVFYAFWEAKEVYSVPFVPVLLMIAAGNEEILPLAGPCKMKAGMRRAGAVLLGAAWIALMVCLVNPICLKEVNREVISLHSGKNSFIGAEKIPDNSDECISQSFSTGQPINCVTLYSSSAGSADPKGEYLFRLLDERGKKAAEERFTPEKFRSGTAVFTFPATAGGAVRSYTVEIRKAEDGLPSDMNLLYQKNLLVDRYEGDYLVSGEKRSGDLVMSVKMRDKGAYASKMQYEAAAGLLTALMIFLLWPYWQKNR